MKNPTKRRPLSVFLSLALVASSIGQPAAVAAGQVVAARVNLSGAMGVSGNLMRVPTPLRGTPSLKLPASFVGLRLSPNLGGGSVVSPDAQTTAVQTPLSRNAAGPVKLLSQEETRELAARAYEQAADKAPRKTLLGRLKGALSLGSIELAFDGGNAKASAAMGIVDKPVKLPAELSDIKLGPAPQAPNPKDVSGISLQGFDIPGTRGLGGLFDTGATILQAEAKDEAAVEKALRALVDGDKARFGVTSADLGTDHVRFVAGVGAQADTVYAVFYQQKDGIRLDGSYLQFTIKVVNGQTRIMGAKAALYPDVQVATQAQFSDEELKNRAVDEIRLPQSMADRLEFVKREIVYSEGAWHAANLYTIEGLPFMVAVDVATGEVFAWESGKGFQDKLPAGLQTAGKVEGRTVVVGPYTKDAPLTAIPLANLVFKIGKEQVVTDRNGEFKPSKALLAELGSNPVKFKVRLSGKYASINDEDGKDLEVEATLTPGETVTVTFNAEGADEFRVAQVNAYYQANRVRMWAADNGINDAKLDVAIPVNVNINDECNAYYTPGRPSLNFFKSSSNCANTAFDSVVMHEWFHFGDDMLGGIRNGAVSEGYGDIGSMYILNDPRIGAGFLLGQEKSWIRDGRNNYQYNEYDEVHDQGQAWMGFAWKLREALKAAAGEAAGAALATALVLPTLYAKAASVPEVIAQVLLNDMDKEGNLPHEKMIRDAADAHGVPLPKSPGSLLAGFVQTVVPSFYGVTALASSNQAVQEDAGDNPVVKKTYEFWAGALVRKDIRYAIERYLSSRADVTYRIVESRSWHRSDYTIVIEGPRKSVENSIRWINRLLEQNQGFRGGESPGTVALSDAWSQRLQAWPERGMGHQKVDVTLKDGTVHKGLVAVNASTLALPAGAAAFAEAAILAIGEAASGNAADELVHETVTFRAGFAIRDRIAAEVRRFCDYHLKKGALKSYKLREERGWFSSDFALDLHGRESVIDLLVRQLQQAGEFRRGLTLSEAEALAGNPKFGAALSVQLARYLAGGKGVVGVEYDDDEVFTNTRALYEYFETRGLQGEMVVDGGFTSVYGVSLADLEHFASLPFVRSVNVDPWGTHGFELQERVKLGQPASAAALRAAYAEVLALRERVWKGEVAPADFYARAEALYEKRFGPEWEYKVRLFLGELKRTRDRSEGSVAFARMTPAERERFFAAMPKGAELHVHLTGAIAPEVWLKVADLLDMKFPAKTVAELLRHGGEDPAALGLDESQDNVSFRAMSEALKQALGRALVTGPNDKSILDFLKKWTIIGPMDRPASQYTLFRALAEASKAQNIPYLEVITTSFGLVLEKAVEAARLVEKETGVVLRLIAYGGWYMSKAQVDDGIAAAKKHAAGGVVGFNMVADEAKFRPLPHYESFRTLRETAPGLKVTLHAGEQPGTADNLVNDLLLGVKRFGHATQVEEDALAMALLYASKTPVEVSLVSNELTRVMPDLSKHPLPSFLAWGVPVTLSTDDPGIFASTLGGEYDRAQSLFGLDWEQLKEISRNGLRHSFLGAAEKAALLAELERRLAAFEASELFRRFAR